jgi:hypothetical protein
MYWNFIIVTWNHMTEAELLHTLQTQLTVSVWPVAAKALGYKTKSAAYAAAARGDIKLIPGTSRRKLVPTLWLRKALFIPEAQAPGRAHHRRRRKAAA